MLRAESVVALREEERPADLLPAEVALEPRFRPEHRSPSDSGELFSEVIADGAELPSGATSLKLTHEPGGTFLAVPLDTSGKPLSQQFWRRSNTRAGALSDRV